MSPAGPSPRFALACLLLFPALALAGCLQPGASTGEPVSPGTAPGTAPGATGSVTHYGIPYDAAPAGVGRTGDATGETGTAAGGTSDATVAGLQAKGASRYIGGEAFEPTLGVDAKGNIFFSAYEPRIPGWVLVRKSSDQGQTWKDVTPRVLTVSVPPQSNDPMVHVDVDTGRVFVSDLQALQCATLSFSDDEGKTWTTNPLGCGHPVSAPPHDHQTVFTAKPRVLQTTGYPNLVYYCINRVVDSACATSLDGGLTFGPLRPLVFQGVEPLARNKLCGGLHAHGAAAPDGTVYIPKGHCGIPMVAISKDDGLTWKVVTISTKVQTIEHEVAFAVDEAGNAYAFWIGLDQLPYLATSRDGGFTWSDPVMVAPPGVGTTDFPTIAAGSNGRVAMAYYGTAASRPYGSMQAGDTWNAYITYTLDALSPTPLLSTVTANDPADPVARGVCSKTLNRCDGVGDFIDIVIDGEGRPWAAFVDVCNDPCSRATGTKNAGIRGFAGTLAEGPRLRGESGSLSKLLGL